MKFKTFINEATRKPEHTHAVTRGGNVISYHTSSKSAHKKADSLDNQYGSTVHSVKLLESEIYEMIPYALSAANANAEHERARRAKKEEEKRKAKEQLDRDSEDNSNPFASMKSVKESHVKVGQRVKFNEPVSGTARHTRKPMSFDGGKVVQVTPTGAMVRPQAWHGDEGLDVHVPHKNIKEEVEQVEEAYNDDRSYTKCQECKKGKYVEKDIYGAHLKCTNCGDVVNRYERDDHPKEPGPSIPKVIAKNNKYEKALAALKKKHGINEEVELDEEMNNRITKIHVRGQNVIVHRYDTEAKGTYKEVKHHSSATAAQTYARQLHKARGGNAELIIKEAKDEGEYDYEGDMAMSQLKSVIANAQKLHDMLKPDTNLPEWVQSKITLAEDYIVTATNYMDGELNEGLVSAIKRAFTPKPKSTEDQIADFRAKTKARTQQNLGPAAKRKPKPYSVRLPDAGRKPESRSEYDANRAMTKENYAIAAKQSQSFKTFRGGVKGKGTGSRRTQTNQVADHVKIYKESTND
jgi:hypothetical protein